jgi:hypothetical protein
MTKAAIVVLAETEDHEDLARVTKALVATKEFKDAGETPIFDGAGRKWPGELAQEDHRHHRLYEEVQDTIQGACAYCARAFPPRSRSVRLKSRCSMSTSGIPVSGSW